MPAPCMESNWSLLCHCLCKAGACTTAIGRHAVCTRQKPLRHRTWVMSAELDLLVPALQPVNYSSSVDIRPEWSVVEQIPFSSLTKLNFTVAKPEEVTCCTHHCAFCVAELHLFGRGLRSRFLHRPLAQPAERCRLTWGHPITWTSSLPQPHSKTWHASCRLPASCQCTSNSLAHLKAGLASRGPCGSHWCPDLACLLLPVLLCGRHRASRGSLLADHVLRRA